MQRLGDRKNIYNTDFRKSNKTPKTFLLKKKSPKHSPLYEKLSETTKDPFNVTRTLKKKNLRFKSIILFLAITGVCETGYITLTKILSSQVFCGNFACSNVLDSSFSSIFGVPISLFGVFIYSIVLVSNLGYLSKDFFKFLEAPETYHYIGAFLATSGIYFTLILGYTLNLSCGWCLESILISSLVVILKILSILGSKVKSSSSFLPFFFIVLIFFLFNYSIGIVELQTI